MIKLARALVVVVFSLSAMAKLFDFDATSYAVAAQFGWSPTFAAVSLAILIVSECAIASGVALSGWRGSYQTAFVFVALATIVAARMGLNGAENCFCFGARFSVTPAMTIAKNVLLLLATGYLIATRRRGRSLGAGEQKKLA